ncbi:MAG: ATP-dependent helicase [Candidatus Omnitrophica bacterium]|nr:ATP-dependent helicase [Candidatus Omnitrophota bacterium]
MSEVKNEIYGTSTADQVKAISHIGTHARLLAGPGTGKTRILTRRVLSLVLEHNRDPEEILLLTFTRLAAAQLKEEVRKVLEPHNKEVPTISTIHAFALRQILFNSKVIDVLPQPIRIADDWEERFIIQEDLKRVLGLSRISEVQDLINRLSADWETLRAEEQGWEETFPNASFLGIWREHRAMYGETLRAELVYRFKKQLSQNRNFKLDKQYKHLLIDEFQDLNSCDLAIVRELYKKGAEVFVVGDDDQSIYGFRYANPVGIRQFPEVYPDTKRLALETCFRCDKRILKAAEFVANLDTQRLPKPTKPRTDANDGDVKIFNFQDQNKEAETIANLIKQLIGEGICSNEIVILLRNDMNRVISKPIVEALTRNGIKTSIPAESSVENKNEYRIVLSTLRLLLSEGSDSLAWRTLLQIEDGIGEKTINEVQAKAKEKGVRFEEILSQIIQGQEECRFKDKIISIVNKVNEQISRYQELENFTEVLERVVNDNISNSEIAQEISSFMKLIVEEQQIDNIENLLKAITVSSKDIEQETEDDAINILTMHQAKGLTFDVCFIVAVEDEFIPGKNQGEKEGDERRLLYVSMTRARHKLFITYCSKRTGNQMYSGRNSGNPNRTLSRFLQDSNIEIVQI